MKTPFRTWLLLLLSVSCTSAPPGFPFANPFAEPERYNDETGLTGMETEPGALAGTWGMTLEMATRVQLPVIGTRNGGSLATRLITRTWNAGANRYEETYKMCDYEIYEVEGSTTRILDGAVGKIPDVSYTSDVDHVVGHYYSSQVVNNWGWRNMPDPANTPLPTSRNWNEAPQSDWMWDQDEDGNPGFTARLAGFLDADAYFVSTNVFHMDGTYHRDGRISGLLRVHRNAQNTISGSNQAVIGDGRTTLDPDPMSHWFDQVKLQDGATCADVIAARNEGRMARQRPF